MTPQLFGAILFGAELFGLGMPAPVEPSDDFDALVARISGGAVLSASISGGELLTARLSGGTRLGVKISSLPGV